MSMTTHCSPKGHSQAPGGSPCPAPGPLPRDLAPCFQEYRIETLDIARDGDLVIERVLAYGDRRALRWLFTTYSRDRTRAWVETLGEGRLPWRRYNLWCVLLDLDPARRARPASRRIWPH